MLCNRHIDAENDAWLKLSMKFMNSDADFDAGSIDVP